MHKVVPPTHSNRSIMAVVVNSENNMSVNTSSTDAPETYRKSVETWKVVCKVSEHTLESRSNEGGGCFDDGVDCYHLN